MAQAQRIDRTESSGAPQGLIELLDHGKDGHPRHLSLTASSRAAATRLMEAAVADAEARGFLAVGVDAYHLWRDARGMDVSDRTLLLVAGPTATPQRAAAALLDAAAGTPRAHVLLTVSAGLPAALVREARARYGEGRRPLRRIAPVNPVVEEQRVRAARAWALVTIGRHAAAVRLLRDVAGFLSRRALDADAGRVLIDAGRLLLERGGAAAADRAFDEAAALAGRAEDDQVHLDARIWQAVARTDGGRLTDAEAICRAALTNISMTSLLRARIHAVLARVLLWQHRTEEASSLNLDLTAEDEGDPETVATIRGTEVRVMLAQGRIFEAGLGADRLLSGTAGPVPRLRLIALHACLRVHVHAGELRLAQACVADIERLGRHARSPMRVVRARLLLAIAFRRAGREADARPLLNALSRMTVALPALLARAIRDAVAPDVQREQPVVTSARGTPDAAHLVVLAHDAENDGDAIRDVVTAVAQGIDAIRIDVWSADAGAAAVVDSVGSGITTRVGPRVLESGLVIGPETHEYGRELGVPVRRGRHGVAALVARWPADRVPPPDARAWLEIAAAVVHPRLESRQLVRRCAAEAASTVPELVGVSEAMREVRTAITRAAAAPFTVLIHGESGVGKELAARAIHQLSARRERPFSDINCAALPDDLLDAELFGHARGAFTGAVAERAGLFESADGGTVFLDEVADLSPRGQAKLLRVLQQREVRRVGETFSRPIDVRLVTAANRDLATEVEAGRFRADLLYRLDVLRVRIPPLRERPEDVAPLALHFWTGAAQRVGTTASLTHSVLAALTRYHWPGNVRELQNVVAALAVAAPCRGQVRAALLPAAITGAPTISSSRLSEARAQFERRAIESALARASGNRSRAARELGLSRQGLLKMMTRLAIG